MEYFVSRQCYWLTDDLVVEIAAGGIDHSGPDMLSDPDNVYRVLGDMLETDDPREALKVAFAIRDEWNRRLKESYVAGKCSLSDTIVCHIEAGYNLDVVMACEELTDELLREWAQTEWEISRKSEGLEENTWTR